jgi:hypothetical protein
MKRLRALKSFQIFKSEIKNQKSISVDVLFKAYPIVPLSCRSNLAGEVPLMLFWWICFASDLHIEGGKIQHVGTSSTKIL